MQQAAPNSCRRVKFSTNAARTPSNPGLTKPDIVLLCTLDMIIAPDHYTIHAPCRMVPSSPSRRAYHPSVTSASQLSALVSQAHHDTFPHRATDYRTRRAMKEASPCLMQILTIVPPVVRRARRFLRASDLPHVPASVPIPAGERSGHPSQLRSFLHLVLREYPSDGRTADRANAEFRRPGLPDAGRTGRFWRPGLPDRRQRT